MYFCITRSIGTQGGWLAVKVLQVVYSTDRSKAVVSVLVLLIVVFLFILLGDLF